MEDEKGGLNLILFPYVSSSTGTIVPDGKGVSMDNIVDRHFEG